jgi:hypothetical protein
LNAVAYGGLQIRHRNEGFGTYKLASNGRARQTDDSNIFMIATQWKQQTVRTSQFALGRSFLDILGASGSQKMWQMLAPLQKASQMAPVPLRLFVLKNIYNTRARAPHNSHPKCDFHHPRAPLKAPSIAAP